MVSNKRYFDITIRADSDSTLLLIKLLTALHDVVDLRWPRVFSVGDQEPSPRKMGKVRTAVPDEGLDVPPFLRRMPKDAAAP
jgi:hypothetical protein